MLNLRDNIKYALLVFMFTINGCTTMETSWRETESVNTIQAYKAFVEQYPSSVYESEVRNRIMQLKWEEAAHINTISAYNEFLREYNTGHYATRARNQIDIIKRNEEIQAYSEAIKSNSIIALNDFLIKFPDTGKREDITNRISELERSEEEASYQTAVNSGSYEELLLYMERYPNGLHSNQIKHKYNSLWKTLSSPIILNWKMIGLIGTVTTSELSKLASEMAQFTDIVLMGCVAGEHVSLLSYFLYCEKGAELKGSKIQPTHVIINYADKRRISVKTIDGYCLTIYYFYTFIPVGSLLVIYDNNSPVNLYGHIIKYGTIEIVADGLKLLPGTNIIMNSGK